MKKLIIGMILFFCIASLSIGQNCNGGQRVAKKVWSKTGKWTSPTSFIPFVGGFKLKKAAWNSIVGNSSATWGPRHIEEKEIENGTVHGGTKRTFVSDPQFYDTAKITINKTGGRGRTVVLVCEHNDRGQTVSVDEYEFPNSGLMSSKVFVIPNVRGKILSVTISCKNAIRSFTYNCELENYD